MRGAFDTNMSLDGLKDGILGISDKVEGIIGNHPVASIGGVALGSAVIGTVIGGAIASKSKRRKSSKKKTRKTGSVGRRRDRKYISKQKHERAYQKRRKKLGKKTYGKYYKRKSKSKKGIHYTKNGQPYKILANGRARFIKKR